ncbi:MAG: cytidine deaminase [Candidatus Cloacimonetes bacterium]|nr:cytidine deaminase [Candidatus Cloacimonadota bacterium]
MEYNRELLMKAVEAAKLAYSPYSHYKVGAALLTRKGDIYTGCNIENATYSATICAERTAMVKAISNGERDFVEIAIYVDSEELFPPCGICRQFMAEFCEELIVVYASKNSLNSPQVTTLNQLLPQRFKL